MTLRKQLVATAVALGTLGAALPAAQAQTLTVTAPTPTLANGLYTYTYSVTPTGNNSAGAGPFSVNYLVFNFSDPNETFLQVGGSGNLGLMSQTPGTGVFTFGSLTGPTFPVIPNGATETFAFISPDAPGSTLGAVGVAFNGSGVASINGVSPAPAPEPGTLASMAVLGTCLGLGIVARRRSSLVA